ncbi:ABC transporter permease [Ideonella sp. B7]|uniref:ABC transporter permease n=1 Tax=Ideonella benzenivorans TaxID=2831643 RepID=UPI001CEDD658|nr:ABC transporter permease [Ideonella benzenivorans]MCA6216223.1 ABC transporter permease [Ideonella benzenivorans]
MKALNLKLLRDLRLMWSQALTIALVVASGVGGFITTLSAVDSLARARDAFYAQGHFADVFVSLKRAPLSLADTLRALPGVADVQTTVEADVRVQIEGQSDPIIGHLIGLDVRRPPRLNLTTLRGPHAGDAADHPGRPRTDGTLPVWVSEAFAEARGLRPGSHLTALINGRERTLEVTGTALSPEYIFAGPFGIPDQRGFGVFWVDGEALAAAYDMADAFNHVAVKLAPGADLPAVRDALQRRLARYGGREAIAREDQTSHAMLDNEIKEQHVLGSVLPAIFLGVASFLLNVVVSRLVATQREQIATLKALGYPNSSIGAHYLKLVLAIVALGCLLGLGLGSALGRMLTGLYAEFFRFPRFEHVLPAWLVLLSVGTALLTAVAGTLNAIAATVRLAPAEAMRPPAPGHYRRTLVERLGLARMNTTLRMILRQMERRPLRTALSIGGVAAAVAIVVMGSFFRDAMDRIVDMQFHVRMRADVQVWLYEPGPQRAGLELARLPGVLAVEPARQVAVTLVNGHHRERAGILGQPPDPQLLRAVDLDDRVHTVPGQGLLLTDRLATKLGLRVGDTVQVEVLEGRGRVLQLPVDAVVDEMMGLNAYMDLHTLNRLLGDDDLANAYLVQVARGQEDAFLAATRALPQVAGAFSKASMLRNMQEVSARNVRIMGAVLTAFAAVIAVGVVYNNARIALAERAWELASLRVLGFTRGEVSALLLGELGLSIAVALPLGMLLGSGLVHAVTELLKSDQFHFPVALQPRSYAWAALCVAAAGLASALVVRRRIDRLDIVGALKTRE